MICGRYYYVLLWILWTLWTVWTIIIEYELLWTIIMDYVDY